MTPIEIKWAKAVEIIDNGELTQTETLVALGILRHSDDNLAEAAPGGAALAHYGRVKKRSAIAKAIAGLKAKGIVRNRHAGFHARVFTFADEVAAAVIAYRETLPAVRPTPPPCTPQGHNNSATCTPEGNINVCPSGAQQPAAVCPSGVQQGSPPCTHQGHNNSATCAPQGYNNVCPSGVQHEAPSLPLREVSEGKGDTDLFGGRGPVVGVRFPVALMHVIEKGTAPVAASALEEAVRAQIKAGAASDDIEAALRKAIAAAEVDGKTTPSQMLRAAVGYVENVKRFADQRERDDAIRRRGHGKFEIPSATVTLPPVTGDYWVD